MGDAEPLAALARPNSWAREDPAALPVTVNRAAAATAYESDQAHWEACSEPDCARCHFERGFRGELRRGTSQACCVSEVHSWKERFTFTHPVAGLKTWLAVKPYSWAARWGFGCWVCAHYPGKWASSFSRLEVSTRTGTQPSVLQKHADCAAHREALLKMTQDLNVEEGRFTGVNEEVPRLEKFHLAGTIVASHDSFRDFAKYVRTVALSSALPQNGDFSRQTCAKLVFALGRPLYEQDLAVMRKALGLHVHKGVVSDGGILHPEFFWLLQGQPVCEAIACPKARMASLALDVRDELLLVVGRWYYEGLQDQNLPPVGLYENLVGVARERGSGPEAVVGAVKAILEQACIIRQGRRNGDSLDGDEDRVDTELLAHVKAGRTHKSFSSLFPGGHYDLPCC